MSHDVDEVIEALSIMLEDIRTHCMPDLPEAQWEKTVRSAFLKATRETDLAAVLAYWREVTPDN